MEGLLRTVIKNFDFCCKKGSVKEPNMSTTMKLRKSLVKPVMWQKTCNYIELFGSSARDRHARRI